MKSFRNFMFFAFLSFLGLILFMPESNVNAQSVNISYSPSVKYVVLNPGQTYTEEITVKNPGKDKVDFGVLVRSFTSIEGKPGVPKPLSEESTEKDPYSAADWTSFPVEEFSLGGDKSQKYTATITVPEDASPGGHYVGIYFVDITSRELEDVAVGNILMGGPIFLITVPGDVDESIIVIDFDSEHNFYEYPPVTHLTTIQNNGNVHVAPRGEIRITNMFQQKVATVKVNENKYHVLPGKESVYEDTWDPGKSLFRRLFTKDWKPLFGKMKAELVLMYRTNDPGLDYHKLETTYWVIPWKLILLILLIIFVIVLYLRRKTKKKGKSGKSGAKKSANKKGGSGE